MFENLQNTNEKSEITNNINRKAPVTYKIETGFKAWFCFQIEDAQVQDSGRYTCEATNVAGKTEKNYNVNIWGKWDQPLIVKQMI